MNEACIDLQKSGRLTVAVRVDLIFIGTKGRCEFLPPKENEAAMLDARDSILVGLTLPLAVNRALTCNKATVRDIEDVVAAGKEMSVCPYYATRKAVKQAEVTIVLPFTSR